MHSDEHTSRGLPPKALSWCCVWLIYSTQSKERDCLFPFEVMVASSFVHLGIPTFIDSPILGQVVDAFKKTNCQSSGVGAPGAVSLYCGTTGVFRISAWNCIRRWFATIPPSTRKKIGSNIGFFRHCLTSLGPGRGGRLQNGASNVPFDSESAPAISPGIVFNA